jgi:hypothetical protein
MMSAAEEYQDPEKVSAWLSAQAEALAVYLARQHVRGHAPVARWDLAPYIAVWELTGGWAISGDLPTDYVLDETIQSARDALRFFSHKFADLAECMLTGRRYPGTTIGDPDDPDQQRQLGELLKSRAKTLGEFADTDGLWTEDDGEPDQGDESRE